VIITKTPVRVSLGGGGTDLPEYYTKHGGLWIAGAIDKFIYVAVKRRFEPQIRLSYSELEVVDSVQNIRHPIIRVALDHFNIRHHVEVTSFADLPSRTGLGSSGAFTVGLINALSAYTSTPVENPARLAFHFERDLLHRTVGLQDQYAAMLGGVRVYSVKPSGEVFNKVLDLPNFHRHFLLYYTGIRRRSEPFLTQMVKGDSDLSVIAELGEQAFDSLRRGDLDVYGRLMHQHWEVKKKISPDMSTPEIDRMYEVAREAGALGGKLVGAGGGGFLLLFVPDEVTRSRVASNMSRFNAPPIPFTFVQDGSKVVEL